MEEFEQAAPTATSDRACQEYAPRCAVAEGYYESSPPLEGADRVCTPTTTCEDDEYASRAVQFHPNGGQFDFVRPSPRTPHGAYVWCLTA